MPVRSGDGPTGEAGAVVPDGAAHRTGSRADRRRRAVLAAVPVAVLVSAGLVVQASRAATTASLESESNGWKTGLVEIGSNDGGVAAFTVSKVLPGQGGSRCIRVNYTGNVAADVRLWVEASGALASSLALQVDEGTGNAADCSDFSLATTLFGSAPLSTLASTHHDPATGLGTWGPAGTANRTYRLTWTLPSGSTAQGTSATADFHWTATQA